LVKVRHKKQQEFLEFYGKYGTMALACQEVGIREERIADWRSRDPVFDRKVAQAEKLVGDRLVKEVIHRAVEGEEKTIYNKNGDVVDTVYEKSDSLLMFATKRHRPEFRDRVDIPVITGSTTNIQNNVLLTIDPSKLDGEQLKAYEALLLSAAGAPDDRAAAPGNALPRPAGDPPAGPGAIRP